MDLDHYLDGGVVNVYKLKKVYDAKYPTELVPVLLAAALAIGDGLLWLGFASQSFLPEEIGARLDIAYSHYKAARRLMRRLRKDLLALPPDMARCWEYLQECLPLE